MTENNDYLVGMAAMVVLKTVAITSNDSDYRSQE